jgi:Abortive infection alpha
MSDQGSLIPISDEQAKGVQEVAKAAREALKTLQGAGAALRQIFGTVPEDLVGYLGGDWLKVRRAENIVRIVEKAKARLDARKAALEQPSISVALPLLIAAADESRDELQEIWARLLAAAADPSRAKAFRTQFIEAARQMDPLDAAVLQGAQQIPTDPGRMAGAAKELLAKQLQVSRDEVEVSLANLVRLRLAVPLTVSPVPDVATSAFGREFLRVVSD